MTIPIEISPTQARVLVSGGSRYAKQNVIYYGEKRLLTFDTYVRKVRPRTGQEKLMKITSGVEYRPDLVAYDVYGFPEAWWNILELNGMKDVWEFKAGKTILLPTEVL